MNPLLSLRNIRKQYPGVLALNDVSFDLFSGEIHCLVGENGAGKSTLMKILAGAISSDAGEIAINNRICTFRSPLDAQREGIGMIFQDFKLVPELSVAENILLGNEPRSSWPMMIDFGSLHRQAQAVLEKLGESIDTHLPVSELSTAQQQMVEIAKALSRKVRILVLDEPSASLTDRELHHLFAVIRKLRTDGVGIIYISHRLEEIFDIGDRVTVLRDGLHVHTCSVADTDRRRLIQMMVGRELENEYPAAVLQAGEEILRVEHLQGPRTHDVSFAVRTGEIVGISGLVGAGRSELARILFGADPFDSGSIHFCGKKIHPRSPREAIDLGIGLLTEDRNRYGLIMEMNIAHNITLSSISSLLRHGLISQTKERKKALEYSAALHIKTPSVFQSVEALSGGNRQKVVLARWLATKTKLLIYDEPTVGIDVGVKYEIYTLMQKLAAEGIGVIIISSDLPELLGMSDRILVMCDGRLTGELTRTEATQERVMALATSFEAKILTD